MSRIYRMRGKGVWAVSLSLWFAVLFSTCSKEPDTLICKPLNMKLDSGDSVVFERNSADRLTSILQYHVSGLAPDRYEFEYNLEGKMTKVSEYDVLHAPATVTYRTHAFEYNGDRVAKVTTTVTASGSESVTTYEHNDAGQLTRLVNDVFGSIRYEYNDQGNVSKVFYFPTGYAAEFLAREATVFDNRFMYYEHIPDLKGFLTYVKWYIPGKNNCLSAIIKATISNGQLFGVATATLVEYGVAYNSNGYITGWKPSVAPFNSDTWFVNVNYTCNN